MSTVDPWFSVAFGDLYSRIYAHRSDSQAAAEVAFLVDQLKVDANATLLDLACGAGRHQRAFAARGIPTIGLDYSAELLKEHRRRADLPIVRGDMRCLPFADRSFGAISQLFTAFGYFASEAEDQSVLQEVARVLAPGGRYVLDFLRAERIRDSLVPVSERQVDGLTILEQRQIADGRVSKQVVVRDESGTEQLRYTESVRLYTRSDLETMFEKSSLRALSCFGDFSGARPDEGDRCILIAERAP